MQLTSKTLNSRLLPVIAGLVTAAIVVSATWFISVSEERRQAQTERLDTLRQISTVRTRLEGDLNSRLSLAKSIVSYIAIHGDIQHETFQSLAEELVARDNMIRNVSLLKGTVIVDVCPLEGHKKAIGVDLATVPGQLETVQRVIETKQALIAGPIELVQGGVGIVSRIPIFLTPKGKPIGSGAYWGQVSVVIIQDILFKEAGIVDSSSGLKYALRGKDGLGAAGAIFWGDEAVFESSPVVMDVILPGGTWQMAAMPAAGWGSQTASSLWFCIVGGILSIFAGWIIWSLLTTKKTLQERLILERSLMEQAKENESKYRTLFESSNDAMFIMKGGTFTDCNTASLKIFGCERKQMLGNSPQVFSPPVQPDGRDSREKALEKIASALSGQPQFYEWKHCRYDGTPFHAEVSLNSIEVNGERMVHVTVRDISDRKHTEEALRESEATLRSVLQAAPIGIGLVTNRIFGWTNVCMSQMTGYSTADFIGQSARMLYDSDEEFDRVGTAKYDDIRARGIGSIETRWKCKDGTLIDVFLSSSPIVSGDLSRGVVFSAVDITDRKQAEEKLKEAGAFLETLLYAIPLPLFYKDADGRFTGFNKSYEMFYGKTRQELIGRSVFDIYPRDLAEVYHARDLELFHDPGTQVYDTQLKGADGVVHDVVFHKSTFSDSRGRVLGLIGVILDRTDQKRAEAALRREQVFKNALLENILDGVVACDADGTLVLFNKTAREWHRLDPMAIPQEKWADYYDLYCADGVTPMTVATVPLSRAFRGECLINEGMVIRAKGQPERHIIANCAPFFDEKGTKLGAVGVMNDITESKRAEQEKEALQSQLFQSQKMEALGTLVGGIAHDFNNMLQSILGYSEMLLIGKKKGEPGYRELQTIIETGRGGAQLVKKLLALGQQGQVFPVPLDVNQQISQLATLISRTLPHVVQLDVDLTHGPVTILTDPSQIDQVVMNLAINASEAMPNGGRLKIATTSILLDDEYCKRHHGAKPGSYVMLTVTDTGRGMHKKTLSRIFDPFFSTKERGSTRGTGLGLSVVKGIVQQQGGHVTCESEPGKGTTFKVYFPAIEATLMTVKTVIPTVESEGAETILVVEDNIPVAELEQMVLENAGYTVIVASNGQDALDIYRTRREEISLVILDLLMPEMSGRDCLMEVLNIDPSVKVLIASGYAPEDELHKEISPLVKGFVHKPFGIADLLTSVRSVMVTD